MTSWEYRDWESQKGNHEASIKFLGELDMTLTHLKWIRDTFGNQTQDEERAMVKKWRSPQTSRDTETLRMLTTLDIHLTFYEGPTPELSSKGTVVIAHRQLEALKNPAPLKPSVIFEVCRKIAGFDKNSNATFSEREFFALRAEKAKQLKISARRILKQAAV